MALIHQTTLHPSKLELLSPWLTQQPWFESDASKLTRVGAYRLDDPDGEVGIEGQLLSAGDDAVYHVPVTYRGAPLAEGEAFLIGTLEHGVLGTRWVYNAMGDPVYRAVLATIIAQGGTEAIEEVAQEGGAPKPREITTHLRGSGQPGASVPELWAAKISDEDGLTYANTGFATLAIKRIASRAGDGLESAEVLRATWPGHDTPTVLAVLHTEQDSSRP